MRHSIRVGRWIGVPLLLVGIGCGEQQVAVRDAGGGPAGAPVLTSTDVLAPGGFGVGVTTMTFVDDTRPTMPNGTYGGAPTRTLVTEVWYPADTARGTTAARRDAPVAAHGAPYPVVIYSHGFMNTRTGGAYLARHLASYGYVVASPDFPLTNGQAPGGPNPIDIAEQPGDVRFLIDRILALGADSGSPFSGRTDAQRIALTGLSLGGSTTLLTAFHPTLGDARVRAAAPMAGGACFLSKAFFASRSVPLLILHGELDAIVPYQEHAVFAFEQANSPKYLATIVGGTHTAFADGIEFLESANNLDDLGCGALGGVRDGDGEVWGGDLFDRLGGAAAGIVVGDCPPICVGARPRSIRPSRQQQLTILSVLPFFEATLRNDARAREFLERTLAAENGEMLLRSAR